MENEPPDRASEKIIERLRQNEEKRKKAMETNEGAG